MRRSGAAVLIACIALISACESTINGRATCPGCGISAEPSLPTRRPRALPPPVGPSTPAPVGPSTPAPVGPSTPAPVGPSTPAPVGPSTPAPVGPSTAPPGGAIALAPDPAGYVFIETKSGKTRCQISRGEVGCEAQFADPPIRDGEPANGVNVTADGDFRWVVGNLGDIPAVQLDYQTYQAQGWTIDAASSGTRFTNDQTGHGMFVSVESVAKF